MNVLIICDAVLPVPPVGYGGIERIVDALCRGLVQHGWDVSLLANPSSTVDTKVFAHKAPGRSFFSRAYRKILFQPVSIAAAKRADIIVNFGRIDYLVGLGFFKSKTPIVFCFQNPLNGTETSSVDRLGFLNYKLVSISNQQRENMPGEQWLTIYNSVDISRYIPSSTKGSYLAYLGRLNRNKGVDIAIQAAKRSGKRLKIAGNIPNEPGAKEFFDDGVKPYLDGNIEWIGEVFEAEKVDFLSNAEALLLPLRWDEPFGIVMVEALSCGVPVVAFPRGSVPEIIEDGVNGYIVNDINEMVTSIARLDKLDRETCRKSCEKRFSERVMIESYISLFESMQINSQR